MKYGLSWIVAIALVSALIAGCGSQPPAPDSPAETASSPAGAPPPARLISMAPGLTEILFALGLGGRVKGVTRYCVYPPEAKEVDQIGGFLDPNYEAIVALEPDLVFLTDSQSDAATRLNSLGVRCQVIPLETIEDVLEAITDIGAECGAKTEADKLVKSMRASIEALQEKVKPLPHPRVMIVAGRDYGSGSLDQVYITGPGGFHGKIVTLAGGTNAYEDEAITYPMVSSESILSMNPDVIIEMMPEFDKMEMEKKQITSAWEKLTSVSAVEHGRIHVFTEDYVSIPGPRLVKLLEDVARAIHPELERDAP